MAKARVQSDIDTDFEYLRKDDVIAAEANDYGYDCFAKIETFGTMLVQKYPELKITLLLAQSWLISSQAIIH